MFVEIFEHDMKFWAIQSESFVHATASPLISSLYYWKKLQYVEIKMHESEPGDYCESNVRHLCSLYKCLS